MTDDDLSHIKVEVTHEALIRHWSRLRKWIDEDRYNYKLLEELNDDAQKWDICGRADNMLPRWNVRLEEGMALFRQPKFTQNKLEQDYLNACILLRDKEERWRRKKNRMVLLFAVVAMIFSVIALFLYYQANQQKNIAESERRKAKDSEYAAIKEKKQALKNESMFLANMSKEQNDKENYAKGILFALKALPGKNTDRPYVPEAELQLLRAAIYLRENKILRHECPVFYAGFTPDGNTVVTAAGDNTVKWWNFRTGKMLARVEIPVDSSYTGVQISSDGQRGVTIFGDDSQFASVWDTITGEQVGTMLEHADRITHAAFSPNRKRVATASWDNTASVWETETGRQISVLRGHTDKLCYLSFSPDSREGAYYTAFNKNGDTIVTGDEKEACIWDSETGKLLIRLASHDELLYHAAFSPDGNYLITASGDKTAGIWDIRIKRAFYLIHVRYLNDAVFSPDNRHAAMVLNRDGISKILRA